MKKTLFSLILFAFALGVGTVQADKLTLKADVEKWLYELGINDEFRMPVVIDGISYMIYDSTCTAEVTFHYSDSIFALYQYKGDIVVPEVINYNDTNYTVTAIGYQAFGQSADLTSVTLPKTIASIGTFAFDSCVSLVQVNIPDGITKVENETFNLCASLKSIVLPNSITEIREGAFERCGQLTSINIPNNVKYIGAGAFYGTALASPIYTAEVFVYLPASYAGHYSIPEGIKHIAGAAFRDCRELSSVTIPGSVVEIGEEAFGQCEQLTAINIPNSVTTIRNAAFRDCHQLASVVIPNSVTKIGSNIFAGCESLTSPVYTERLFVYLPQTYSGGYSIPDGIEVVCSSAFEKCAKLKSVDIPSSVNKVESFAFNGCTDLKSITIRSTTPPRVGIFTFDNRKCSEISLFVPKKSISSYKKHIIWENFNIRGRKL